MVKRLGSVQTKDKSVSCIIFERPIHYADLRGISPNTFPFDYAKNLLTAIVKVVSDKCL
jgi:hypothetical protein